MPLTQYGPRECSRDGCSNETFYYKEVFIPYSEGVYVSALRRGRGKIGRIYLCPEDYELPTGEGYVVEVDDKRIYGEGPIV
jgi:hypothetical protein